MNKGATNKPYRLGVALSGGGARGFAHAGALLAIEEAGLKPDVIAGVSAGSIVAVLYASGKQPIEVATTFAGCHFRDFTELSFGKAGFFKIDKFVRFILKALGGATRLEDLKIPTYVGATDLDHARPVAFDHGEIGPRIMASCSIPIIFRPVKIDGINYVDGGVLRNHPAWILRDKCDTLIGVNVSPISNQKEFNSIFEVAMRTYNLMAKANQAEDMAICDVSVSMPQIAEYAVFDLKHIKNLFVNGYISTRAALKKANMWHPAGQAPSLAEIPQ